MIVHKLLKDHFSQYVDYHVYRQVENQLDNIAREKLAGKKWCEISGEPFSQLIKKKNSEVKKSDVVMNLPMRSVRSAENSREPSGPLQPVF
jgi:DNA topoisomerase-1